MLDPRGDHGQQGVYLRLLLEQLGLACPGHDLLQARIKVESSVENGRLDLAIEHPRFRIFIENKPTARFGHEQIVRYREALDRCDESLVKRLVIFRGWGEEDDISLKAGAITLHLGHDVRLWVADCAKATEAPDVQAYLNRLDRHLMKRFTGSGEQQEMAELIEIVTQSPGSMRAAMHIAGSIEIAKTELINQLYRTAAGREWPAGLSLGLSATKLYLQKNSELRVDFGDPDMDVAISFEKVRSPTEQPVVGLARRSQGRDFGKWDANAVGDVWGSGVKDAHRDGWWLWYQHWDQLPFNNPRDGIVGFWADVADRQGEGLLKKLELFTQRLTEARP
jgi:hypothetical protein